MSFDRGRRGKRRDKRDNIGEEFHDPFASAPYIADNDRGSHRGGGQGFDNNDLRGGGRPRGGMPAQVVGEGKGAVKFFNGQKGFGFIANDAGGDDVFVHISAVERAGLDGLAEGQELEFTLVDRGGKTSASDLKIIGDIIPVTNSRPQRESRDNRDQPRRQTTGERTSGTVKFFNSQKGFGFISRDDGESDAFVHISAVERSGLMMLNEGDRLEFDLEIDRKGKFSAVNLAEAN